MPFWPFFTMIRDTPKQAARVGGKKRDRGKAKASRDARKRNRR